MKTLSVAIIGAGNIAGGYDLNKRDDDTGIYTHAGAYAAHGGFELRSVFDSNRVQAKDFSGAWNVPYVAADIREIFHGHHDVVSVCSPDHTHFEIVRDILDARCCRSVFVEKPLAMEIGQLDDLIRRAEQHNINIIVNFQRRNEPVHLEIRNLIASRPESLLSVTGHYMKGLRHIGVTMIDTLAYLCGLPDAVQAYNRVFNQEVGDDSYEFVLFYPGFTAAVKTADADRFYYNYHIFEVDLLFSDRRSTLVDISQAVREEPVTGYAYSGVKIMNAREAHYRETAYKRSMVDAVGYVHDVTTGKRAHEINTPQSSFNNLLMINQIIESFDRGSTKLTFESRRWKR